MKEKLLVGDPANDRIIEPSARVIEQIKKERKMRGTGRIESKRTTKMDLDRWKVRDVDRTNETIDRVVAKENESVV